MRVAAGVALGALGLAAVVASGHASGASLATLGFGEGSEGAFDKADSVRLNAAAQATLAKQTAQNAKSAAEEADATYADAQASTPCKDDADCPCSYWYG